MEIQKIAVIGAGQMGSGIAQVAAASGLQVILSDIFLEYAEKGKENIARNLARLTDKGRLEQAQAETILANIAVTAELEELGDADFVIEAAVEQENAKFKLFNELDTVCGSGVILASNTSSIPIGRIAGKTSRPDKVIGMHFMNPVPMMKLVEIIRGLSTSEETFKITRDLAVKFGKTPAEAHDYPGFIANRILLPMINEAVFCLYQGVGNAEDIDTVMKLGMNHPMGPLSLADLIGLDTCLAIMETLYDGFKDSKYRPCPLLRKYVENGWLGRKSGRGFFSY